MQVLALLALIACGSDGGAPSLPAFSGMESVSPSTETGSNEATANMSNGVEQTEVPVGGDNQGAAEGPDGSAELVQPGDVVQADDGDEVAALPEEGPLAAGQEKFLGGVCCGNQRPGLENYFNQITPENAGKWGSVEAVRDQYNWAGLDEAVELAEANGFVFRFHVLLWGSQQPNWIEDLPPQEQLEEIREWMEELNARYAGRFDYIEVLNEFENQPPTAQNEGNYLEALGGAGVTGYDWILTGFRMARDVFGPDAKLMLNEYSVINNDQLTGRYLDVVRLLQAENLIDALGFQGHAFSTTGGVEQMVSNINRLGATGLPVMVTELDIDGPELTQLIDYQRLFPAFWENDNVVGVTLWGYRNGHWRQAQGAPLITADDEEKPALRWLKGYVRGSLPVIVGQANVTISGGSGAGTEVATFTATAFDQSNIAANLPVQWAIADADADVAEAIAFAGDGSGRLQLVDSVPAGTYQLRIFVDVDATVSNLFTVQLTIQ